jgi:hypothetical protein
MSEVFISYSEDGAEFAKHIQDALEKVGITSFLAERNIPYGEEFGAIIDSKIDDCTFFIVVLTDNACKSDYVKYEISRATIKDKKIIPCKYRTLDKSRLPDTLQQKHYFEFETKQELARRAIIETSPEISTRGEPMQELLEVGIHRTFIRHVDSLKPSFIQQLEERIFNARGEILMMGNSLRDFFGEDDENWKVKYKDIIKKALDRGRRFRLLLLDPTSESAKERAICEEGEKVEDDERYKESVLFKDIKRVTEWLSLPDRRIRRLIKVRYFTLTPTVFMIRTDDYTFIEQYHIGDLNRLDQSKITDEDKKALCLGGYVPFFMVENNSDFASLMESHFENVWDMMNDNSLEKVIEKIREFEENPKNYRMRQFIKVFNEKSKKLAT